MVLEVSPVTEVSSSVFSCYKGVKEAPLHGEIINLLPSSIKIILNSYFSILILLQFYPALYIHIYFFFLYMMD